MDTITLVRLKKSKKLKGEQMTILSKQNFILFILCFLFSVAIFSCRSTPKKNATLDVEQTEVLDFKKDLIREGNTLKFSIKSILFAYKSTSIIDDRGALDFIYNFSQKCDQNDLTYTIKVIGHTDTRGSEAENQILSEQRAKKIISLLEKRGVIIDNHVAFEGRGETEPIIADNENEEISASNSSKEKSLFLKNESQHQANRRVVFEFKFIKAPPRVNVILP